MSRSDLIRVELPGASIAGVSTVGFDHSELKKTTGAEIVCWLNQVHGTDCVMRSSACYRDVEADAMWTEEAGVLLAIRTADCVPVLVADRHGRCVGAAHAGWRGLEEGVIAALMDALPVPAGEFSAWIGPSISQACYEVDPPVWERFQAYPARIGDHPETADKRLLDLPGIAADQLHSLGVGEVKLSGLCTYTDERFYSHRLGTHQGIIETGRIATFAML